MDMEGDLGVDLVLGRPFLRSAKARIDVGRGEICFRVGKESMFFRFKQRKERRILNQQDDKGQAIWDTPKSPLPRPIATRSKKRCSKKVWRKVASSSSSNSPGRAEQWWIQQEKGPALQTQNDEPLPKTNRYVSHDHPPSFYFSQLFWFFPLHIWIFKRPLHARNFSSTFPVFHKNPKIFPSMKILWKINLNIYRSKVWPGTKNFKTYSR